MSNLLRYFIIGLVTGCLGILLYAVQAPNIQKFSLAVSIALMIAVSALVSGAFVGFLFGIPRTLQQRDSQNNQDIGSGKDKLTYQVNTNLEEISDWLTKIMVGIGLTQIPKIINALKKYSNYVDKHGFAGFANTPVFATALLIYFLIYGFFVGYLWTRLSLARAFRHADIDEVEDKIKQVANKLSELEKQAEIDAEAIKVVQKQLNPDSYKASTIKQYDKILKQNEINAAIIPASLSVKSEIFYLAKNVRKDNWKEETKKQIMETTIPIFRALIVSDTKGIYHVSHGQLGFALKDQRQPNWEEANSELTKAIEIRGSWQTTQSRLFYEYNRAICQIHLDKDFILKQKSTDKAKKRILADLQAANSSNLKSDIIAYDPIIKEWLSLNGMKKVPPL
jgi:hypothetical protein